MHGRLFVVMWVWVGMVSAVDIHLLCKYRDFLYEENPFGRLLIAWDGGDVSLFAGAKVAGTVFVMALLGVLFHLRWRYTNTVTATLALFQSLLVMYFFL